MNLPEKIICLFVFLLCYGRLSAQSTDNSNEIRWRNYNRTFEKDQNYIELSRYGYDGKFITNQKDTLTRWFNSKFPGIICESSFVNGKQNGLSVCYHSNGVVHSVNYFLNGLIWETISLADSSGKLHNPGNLVNGTGIVPFMNVSGKDLGFSTYKNGHLNGAYYYVDELWGQTAVKGEVQYKPLCAKYYPALKAKYLNENKDTITDVFDSTTFQIAFYDSITVSLRNWKLLSTTKDSLIQQHGTYSGLNLSFGDPEVTPVGKWVYFDPRTNKTFYEIEFDDCGNEIKRITYDENGPISNQRTKPTLQK